MAAFILSEEYKDVAFLRLCDEENESGFDDALENCLNAANEGARKFFIADFDGCQDANDALLSETAELAVRFPHEKGVKLCFVAQDENLAKKINLAANVSFLKNFPTIADAINYFYWECGKENDAIRMILPSDIGLVPAVRACINEFFALCEVQSKEAFQLEMIIDELCNNAIEHGTQDETKTVEVLCCVSDEQIEINVYNGYSPHAVKDRSGHEIEKTMEKWAHEPNQTEDDFRGRGLGLVKTFSDNFEINSSGDGTWVHVIKKKKGVVYADTN